jgi:hypothetical protein
LTLLAASIYAAVLICVLERKENDALQNRLITSLIAMGIWYSLGVIIEYGVDSQVRTAAGRLLAVGLYVVSLVSVTTYTANLASYLTISKSKHTVSGIDDIKNGKISFNRIGVHLGTSIEDYYFWEISEGNRNFYLLKSRKEQYDSLLNGIIDTTFIYIGVAEYATNNIYCNLTLVGADFDKSAFGIVIPKQWPYAQDLDVSILSLREAGTLNDLRAKLFQTKTSPDSSNDSSAMEIESLGGLFLTFGLISVLSIILFLWKKRCVMKHSLLILASVKKSVAQKVVYIVEDSNKMPKCLQHSKSTSFSKVYFWTRSYVYFEIEL